jgi:hypothetical protein
MLFIEFILLNSLCYLFDLNYWYILLYFCTSRLLPIIINKLKYFNEKNKNNMYYFFTDLIIQNYDQYYTLYLLLIDNTTITGKIYSELDKLDKFIIKTINQKLKNLFISILFMFTKKSNNKIDDNKLYISYDQLKLLLQLIIKFKNDPNDDKTYNKINKILGSIVMKSPNYKSNIKISNNDLSKDSIIKVTKTKELSFKNKILFDMIKVLNE